MKTLILVIGVLLPSYKVYGQELISPCPRLFKYEPRGTETDRWYGTVTLISDSDLSGVWLRLLFNKPSIQLGNWFGEVVTTDNTEYLIKNRNKRLVAKTPFEVRFYVKYNPSEPPPILVLIRLNAKTVCPENAVPTESSVSTGALLTSRVITTTPSLSARPQPQPQPQPETTSFVIQGGGFQRPPPSGDDDADDFFHGDFAVANSKPIANNFDEAACGTVISSPRPLITYGQGTREGEFPWHAALYHAKGIDLTYFCGASLITKSHLITVAHCVTRRKSESSISPEDMVVYLGKYYLRRWSNVGIQNTHIDKISIHPEFNAQTYTNDIAILKLVKPAKITDYVRTICLWGEGQTDLNRVVGKLGTVVGWGFDEHGKVTEQLTKAQMPIVSQETCIYSFPDFYSRFTSNKTFCAGFQNGTSVCNGDSGGGLILPKATQAGTQQTVWQLRGLVSISVALQNQLKCDSSHYVVFTDVAKYLNWIKTILNK